MENDLKELELLNTYKINWLWLLLQESDFLRKVRYGISLILDGKNTSDMQLERLFDESTTLSQLRWEEYETLLTLDTCIDRILFHNSNNIESLLEHTASTDSLIWVFG